MLHIGKKEVKKGKLRSRIHIKDDTLLKAEPLDLDVLERCIEHYEEVSERELDKTKESAVQRSRTLSARAAVEGFQALYESEGNIREAKEDATISLIRLREKVYEAEVKIHRTQMALKVIIFFAVYAAAILLQRTGQAGADMATAVTQFFAKTRFASPATEARIWPYPKNRICNNSAMFLKKVDLPCTTSPYVMIDFLDIQTPEDFWDWLPNLFLPRWYANQRGELHQRFRVADGFRIVQRRGFANMGCVFHFMGPITNFSSPFCYDRLIRCLDKRCVLANDDNRHPFGVMANKSRYVYSEHRSATFDYRGGFWSFFPSSNERDAITQLAHLKQDRWSDSDAQWIRIDFPVISTDSGLIGECALILDIDPAGRIQPVVTTHVTRISWYDFNKVEDIIRTVLEILTLIFWIQQCFEPLYQFSKFRKLHSKLNLNHAELWNRYSNSPMHSSVRVFQSFLFVFIFALWIGLNADPYKRSMQVDIDRIRGPDGEPLFMEQMCQFARAYFIINSVNCGLFAIRLLSCLELHYQYAALINVMRSQIYNLASFAFILFVIMWMFSLQGLMMFSNKVVSFSDFGYALASSIQVPLTTAAGNVRKTHTDSTVMVFQKTRVGYNEIREIYPTIAWMYYYPLLIMVKMFLFCVVIAFLKEGYDAAKASAKRRKKMKKFGFANADEAIQNENSHIYLFWEIISRNFESLLSKFEKGSAFEKNSWKKAMKGIPDLNLKIILFCDDLLMKHSRTPRSGSSFLDLMGESENSFQQQNGQPLTKESRVHPDCISIKEFKSHAERDVDKTLPSWIIDFLIQRYPSILNYLDDLQRIIFASIPPASKSNAKESLRDGIELLEQATNTQASIHAKLDFLIRSATV